jgi:hypothetical protein
MKDARVGFSCETELPAREELHLPQALVASIGPGRWRVTIEPVRQQVIRNHSAFLKGYAIEDEGLYDAYSAG